MKSIPQVGTYGEALESALRLRAQAEQGEAIAARQVREYQDDCRALGLRLCADVVAEERKRGREVWEMSPGVWSGVIYHAGRSEREEFQGSGAGFEAASRLAEADAAYRSARAERQHWERTWQQLADELDADPAAAGKILEMRREWLPGRRRDRHERTST